jgi:hypothetical protein
VACLLGRFLEFGHLPDQSAIVVGCLQESIPEGNAVLPPTENGHAMDLEETLGTAAA